MMSTTYSFIFSFVCTLILCDANSISLPKLYEMDDPEECADRNGIFCKVDVILSPYNYSQDSAIWIKIQEFNKDYRYFQRNKLKHGRCFYKEQAESIEDILSNNYATRYLNYSLVAKANYTSCFEKDQLILNELDKWDIISISFGILYGSFVIISTIYMVVYKYENKITKTLNIFSLISSWKELQKPIKNEDFQSLKSIQGIRTVTMMFIISAHAFYGNMFLFLKNPEFLENIYLNLILRVAVTVYPFLVQTFFLISAWLLSVQLIKIIRDHKELTLRHVMIILVSRYFRLMPLILISIAVHRSNLAYDFISYVNQDILKREVDNCRFFWWKNLIFIQTFFEPTNICSSVTWYVATDYQLYTITVFLFYVSHKLKIERRFLMIFLVIVSVIIQSAVISSTEFLGIMRLFPKTANLGDELVSKAFTLSYIPIWCNAATYMLGVMFGSIYSWQREEKISHDNLKKIVWFCSFFGLPIFAMFVTSFMYEIRWFEILVSVFARPIFSAGIGIGILGMATGYGGQIYPHRLLPIFCTGCTNLHDI
ncbi:hypothetical protein WA026_003062 [Henosepilachna vigintioctopunctata]|uniref:Acyltransferase 3 domain-containing protein n=1 Tax=Henosepilachna vigintioctopunctata TaxID=420089 RepID=A0AAW1TMZ5_9CUCU